MKKYLTSILLGLLATTSFAQVSTNIFADRAELIRKLGTSQSFSMGWYTGAISNNANDIRDMNDNYLGLSNYLSVKLNNLVVLELIKSDRTVAEEGLKGNFDILYTSSLIGSQLVAQGWKPIVERSESFTPVVIALKSNNAINSEKDFSKTKIVGSSGTTTIFTEYSLSESNLLDINNINQNQNFIVKKISQESLVGLLNNQQADGIIVRGMLAEKLLNESDKYKIVYKAKTSPGHMILLNPKVDSAREEQIRNVFLSINGLDKNSVGLRSIDGHKSGVEVFKTVSADDMKTSSDVFKKTKQMPLNKNTK
jgi:ABC-type phosphate/phosphonate transport system substrate-binding protein